MAAVHSYAHLEMSLEEIRGIGKHDLPTVIEIMENNLTRLKDRRATLLDFEDRTDASHLDDSQTDQILSKIAMSLSSVHLDRLGYEFLKLKVIDLENASDMMQDHGYRRIVHGLEYWCTKNRHHAAGGLHAKLCEAAKAGLLHKNVPKILRNTDKVENDIVSQLACKLTPQKWGIFSKAYLGLDESFGAMEIVEEQGYVFKQAFGILKLWKNRDETNTNRKLLNILNKAHSAGLVSTAALEVIDPKYEPSQRSKYEETSSIKTLMQLSSSDSEAQTSSDSSSSSSLREIATTGVTIKPDPVLQNLPLDDSLARLNLKITHHKTGLASVLWLDKRKQLLIYNESINTWQHNQELPGWCHRGTTYCDVTNASVGRGVVAVGGYKGKPNVSLIDIVKSCSTHLPDLSKDVMWAGVHCTQEGQLYVIGGNKSTSAYRLCINDSSSNAGISNNEWYQLPDIIHSVECPIVLSDNTHLYTLGGWDSSSAVQIYDISRSIWSDAPSLPEVCNAGHHGAVIDGDEILVFTEESLITYNTHTYTHTTTPHGIQNVDRITPVMYIGQLCVYVEHASDDKLRKLYTYDKKTYTHTKCDIDVSDCGRTRLFFAL